MKALFVKYSSKYNATETHERKLAESLTLIIAVCCSFYEFIWTGIYDVFFGLTTLLSLIVSTTFMSHFERNYKILVYAQLIYITWISVLIQWSLGSIQNSSFTMAWYFLSSIGAFLFLNQKQARIWLVMFLSILGITVVIFPSFSLNGAQINETVRRLFYLLNIGIPFLIIFIFTTNFFKGLSKQTSGNYSLLEIIKEKNQGIKEALKHEKELGLLKTKLVSIIPHQFRTRLTLIQSSMGLLEMLTDSISKQELKRCKKTKGRINLAIAKMTELINDTLVFTKRHLETSKTTLKK